MDIIRLTDDRTFLTVDDVLLESYMILVQEGESQNASVVTSPTSPRLHNGKNRWTKTQQDPIIRLVATHSGCNFASLSTPGESLVGSQIVPRGTSTPNVKNEMGE